MFGSTSGKRIHINPVVYEAWERNMRSWKGRFNGHRCFLVGNGPSLRDTPLEKIWGEYSFGLNRIAEIYPHTVWRPSFYVNVTVGISDEDWAASARVASRDTVSFIGHGELAYLLEEDATEVPPHIFPIKVIKERMYSYDASKWVSKYGSSMLAVFQLATYMGFNPIYLLGCDCKWEPFDYFEDKDPNHFVEHYWGQMKMHGEMPVVVDDRMAKKYTDDSFECHRIAKAACDNIGVEVYNATVGGDLEIYPRVTYAQALAR